MCTLSAQEDLRLEENIDAFSMGGGELGRASPPPGHNPHDDNSGLYVKEELGHSSEWKIESVIEWKRVVELYFIYKGEFHEDGTAKRKPGDEE